MNTPTSGIFAVVDKTMGNDNRFPVEIEVEGEVGVGGIFLQFQQFVIVWIFGSVAFKFNVLLCGAIRQRSQRPLRGPSPGVIFRVAFFAGVVRWVIVTDAVSSGFAAVAGGCESEKAEIA